MKSDTFFKMFFAFLFRYCTPSICLFILLHIVSLSVCVCVFGKNCSYFIFTFSEKGVGSKEMIFCVVDFWDPTFLIQLDCVWSLNAGGRVGGWRVGFFTVHGRLWCGKRARTTFAHKIGRICFPLFISHSDFSVQLRHSSQQWLFAQDDPWSVNGVFNFRLRK